MAKLPEEPWWKRMLWLVTIWGLSVLALGVVAYGLRVVMGAAGLVR